MPANIRKLRIVDLEKPTLSQSRVSTDPETIVKYQKAWETGGSDSFPAIVVFQDGDKYHIADGFHRVQSLMLARLDKKVEHRTIACEVHSGTLQQTIAYSLGANLKHGLLPSTADKKRAILLYYSLSSEHCAHSNNQVAKACGCSHTFVGSWKTTSISTPIEVTFAETKIPISILKQTIENLIAAQAEGKIVTTRNGKVLEQSPKAPTIAPKPLLTPLTSESKAPPEPKLYIVTTTTARIPRGTIIEGWESLTESGNIVTNWEVDTLVIPSSDTIEIPFELDAKVTPIYGETEHTVTGYSLVGTDLKVQSIDHHGFACTHSSEMLKRYIKKDAVEKSTTPIIDLTILSDNQLHDLQYAIDDELASRVLP